MLCFFCPFFFVCFVWFVTSVWAQFVVTFWFFFFFFFFFFSRCFFFVAFLGCVPFIENASPIFSGPSADRFTSYAPTDGP